MEVWIPVVVAVVSAITSGMFAFRSNALMQKAQSIRELEARMAVHKVEAYRPIFDTFRKLLDPSTLEEVASDPAAYSEMVSLASQNLALWGSDEAARSFQRFLQSTYAAAPAPVIMRLYVEFVLAARRDLGYPDTSLTGEEVLGVRIRDYYTTEMIRQAMERPLADVYVENGWAPPWESR